MIVWLEQALVLAMHDRQIAEHGGSAGVRDEGLLESALARPQQLHAYGDPAPDLADLAAALAFGIARNHPFVDGNKRTAAVACETFIELNSAMLDAEDLELFPLYLDLAEGKLGESEFAAWLRARIRVPGRGEAHEPRAAYRTKPRKAKHRRKRARHDLARLREELGPRFPGMRPRRRADGRRDELWRNRVSLVTRRLSYLARVVPTVGSQVAICGNAAITTMTQSSAIQ